jgi:hypothetical protein
MDHTIECIVCRNFLPEAEDYLGRQSFKDQVLLTIIEPRCGFSRTTAPESSDDVCSPEKKEPSRVKTGELKKVFLLEPSCPLLREKGGSSSSDPVRPGPGGCLGMVAPDQLIENLLREGAYLVSPGWLERWEEHVASWGFTPDDLCSFCGESMEQLCLLDTLTLPDSRERLPEMGRTLDLPVQRIPLGMSFFDSFADARFSDGKGESAGAHSLLSSEEKVVADYAMALDLLAQLSFFHTESEVIQNLLNLCVMLFAPGTVEFLRITDGRPVGLSRPRLEEVPPDAIFLSTCPEYLGSRKIIQQEGGLIIPLYFSDQLLGVLFISDISLPGYMDSYRSMLESIMPICSLSLNNARNYEVIVKSLEVRERLLSIIGHDLRGPLGGDKGTAQIAGGGYSGTDI